MSDVLISLALGTISMIIVFFSGLASGAVRIGTLTFRGFVAFCLSTAVSYVCLMLFEMYGERLTKKTLELEKEVAEGEDGEESGEGAEGEEEQAGEEGFKPANPNDLPQA